MCGRSRSLTGPYRQNEIGSVEPWKEMNIDTYLFRDDDGKHYMYHARFQQQGDLGGNTIFVVEYDMATGHAKEGRHRAYAQRFRSRGS